MRLMLGENGKPSLLVETKDTDREFFKFWVVNGGWEGIFRNGRITILMPAWAGDWTSLNNQEILCYNQDRLRGEYNTVFNNFDNPEYVAPREPEIKYPASWDDDIAF